MHKKYLLQKYIFKFEVGKNCLFLHFTIHFMPESMLILITFIVALAVGIFIGKLLFTAQSKSEKSGLEERINGLLNQIEQLKIQFQTERNQLEKSLVQLSFEKENLQREKESLAIHLAKKETDFENLWERNKEQKDEVEKLAREIHQRI
jgi:DNA recombination protein RmuC